MIEFICDVEGACAGNTHETGGFVELIVCVSWIAWQKTKVYDC